MASAMNQAIEALEAAGYEVVDDDQVWVSKENDEAELAKIQSILAKLDNGSRARFAGAGDTDSQGRSYEAVYIEVVD